MRRILRFTILLISFCALQQANAQPWGKPSSPPESKQQIEEKKKKSKAKFKTTKIKELVTIPFVPAYPTAGKKGIKLVRAQKYSSLGEGNNCVVQSFMLKDPPDNVRDWYQASLAGNGWAVQPGNRTNTQILGRRRKEGASVHVMITPSSSKKEGFKSQVQIRYFQGTPLADQS